MKKLTINFDGGNAKGVGTWAVIARCESTVVAKLTGLLDDSLPQTNNTCEWTALYMSAVLAFTLNNYYDRFEFKGDSELVVKQIGGEYAVTKNHLKPLYTKTLRTLLQLKEYSVSWIPREENSEADELGRILR